jgi:hypothetical protein
MADRKSFLLRIDANTYKELQRWAGAELRSVNAQIEFILRQALRRRKGGKRENDADSPGSDSSHS